MDKEERKKILRERSRQIIAKQDAQRIAQQKIFDAMGVRLKPLKKDG